MAEKPKVFISYSHDTPDHKRWVAMLATKLRDKGVDAMLDQWDLRLGDDVTLFIERGLTASDRVLVICTPEYVRKAEDGEGGVGYERIILTAELVTNVGTNKFIPVIREGSEEHLKPVFLNTRYHIDFRNNEEFDAKFDELLKELHQVPVAGKPPVGPNPFATSPSGQAATQRGGISIGPISLPNGIVDAQQAYELAFSLGRSDDLLGWRKHVMSVKGCLRRLQDWREKYEPSPPTDEAGWQAAVDEAVTSVAPLFVTALVGVASEKERLRDQSSLVDDILHVQPWSRAGYRGIIGLLPTLVFVYQALHGAICVSTSQLRVAIELADMKVRVPWTGEYQRLWSNPELLVWSRALGGVTQSWSYLSEGLSRWEWLSDLFGSDEAAYRTALVTYYMALNVHELAVFIAEYGEVRIAPGSQKVRPWFLAEGEEITDRAMTALEHVGADFRWLWESQGVSEEAMQRLWPQWMQECSLHLGKLYGHIDFRWSRYHKLFEALA